MPCASNRDQQDRSALALTPYDGPPLVPATERWQSGKHNRHAGAEAARKTRKWRRSRRTWTRRLQAFVEEWGL